MLLAPGTRFGPYEIVAPLGAGGMGEVYRARDTRLGRDVAVKVLPRHLSATPEVRTRFEREARTISQLNHPNICSLFDVGLAPGTDGAGETDYLVMELVEGGTLAERLEKGPLTTAEVLRLGGQVADALDRAHRAGVIHRDLKPGNVMLTRAGAKLMDFGLARVAGLSGPVGPSGVTVGALTRSPTVAQPLTAEGSLVGTFQYMAPEQLEGKEADARTDIWALGCLLYEMATGRRAFAGASQASLISAIMKEEPAPIAQIVPLTPPGLDRLVRSCLAKDPEERVQTAHDVRLQLDWLREAGSSASGAVPALPARRSGAGPLWLALGAVALVAAGAFGGKLLGALAPPPPPMQLAIEAPAGYTAIADPFYSAVSPDGRWVAFVAADTSGVTTLWIRGMDNPTARLVPGNENPAMPFWSPDSRWLGYWTNGMLRKVPVAGGNPEAICSAADARGATWSRKGVIVFAPNASGALFRVPDNGGDPVPVTRVDSVAGETAHRFPCFLPDGRHFLFVTLPGRKGLYPVRIGSLDSPESKPLFDAGAAPRYAAPGYLVYPRGQSLVGQRFDPGRMKLSGEPVSLGDAAITSNFDGQPRLTCSETGVLVMTQPGLVNTEARWLDRTGRPLGTIPLPAGHWEGVTLSRDGLRLAIERRSSQAAVDLWTLDLRQPNPTRFTFGSGASSQPRWSRDGTRIAYTSNDGGTYEVYTKPTAGVAEAKQVTNVRGAFANTADWTADGRDVLFYAPVPETGWNIWRVAADGSAPPVPVAHSRFNEAAASVSPDGKWILYYSDESGRTEAYAQSFPDGGTKIQLSNGGCSSSTTFLAWTRGGREALFMALDGYTLMACDVETVPTFRAGVPHRLFRLPLSYLGIDATADGQRFIVTAAAGESASAASVLVNWTSLMRVRK